MIRSNKIIVLNSEGELIILVSCKNSSLGALNSAEAADFTCDNTGTLELTSGDTTSLSKYIFNNF